MAKESKFVTKRKTLIQYVSGYPGLGKTQGALQRIIDHLLNPNPTTILIYTAPLNDILDEVYSNLISLLGEQEDLDPVNYLRKVSCFYDSNSSSKGKKRKAVRYPSPSLCVKGEVAQAINVSFLGAPSHPDKKSSIRWKRVPIGSVLLISHYTFISNLSSKYEEVFRHTEVLFDEAEKFIGAVSSFSFSTPKVRTAFLDLFDLTPITPSQTKIIGGNTPNKQTTHVKVTIPEGITPASLRKELDTLQEIYGLFGALAWGKTDSEVPVENIPLYRMNKLIDSLFNSRCETYFALSADNGKVLDLLLPLNIFKGFKQVIVLASHFESTQMYHLFATHPYVVLKDITAEFIPYYAIRKRKLEARYAQTYIAPLLHDASNPSKSHFHTPLCPPHLTEELKRFAKDHDISLESRLRDIALIAQSNAAVDLNRETHDKIEEFRKLGVIFDPVEWYVEDAYEVIGKMQRYIKYPDMRDTTDNKENPKKGRVSQPVEGNLLISMNVEFFDNEVTSMLAARFDHVDHYAKGINSLQGYNVIAFLAAINPSRDLKTLFKVLLPDYDYMEDHVGDTCLQCVGRTSIRDKNSKEPVIVVVLNTYVAEILKSKLGGKPTIVTDFTSTLKPLHSRSNGLESKEKAAASKERAAKSKVAWSLKNQERQKKQKRAHFVKKQIAKLVSKQEGTTLSIKERKALKKYALEARQLDRELKSTSPVK